MQYVVHRPRVGVFIDTQNLYHSARDLLEREGFSNVRDDAEEVLPLAM